MNNLIFICLLLSYICFTAATYYFVEGESNELLQNSESLFSDFLYESAVFKEEAVDQVIQTDVVFTVPNSPMP